ncbi:acyl-CoA dehydrogenase family protein [Streptomyces sp. B-S-A8]|uniref:Acyl-CoA dehydrogenase family protein n=1 Tax=Streptomyces solicavernae TaxID=3043614 RepID=A0ABT6RXD1_9ACTN|nr:acyl-CoA dehydrogenase family protein [Streptomyces sp. B-S-A8]MDI3389104.1 acyl-CoA dehydrogenase family protein [Streptomyces sp. B-S-A8]
MTPTPGQHTEPQTDPHTGLHPGQRTEPHTEPHTGLHPGQRTEPHTEPHTEPQTELHTGQHTELHISPEFPAVLHRIAELGPALDAEAGPAEERGRHTEDTVRALLDAGIVRAELPKSLGGYEFSPRQLIEMVEQVSHHDAAAGWTMQALQVMTATTAAYLGPVAAAELFPDVATGKHALLAGQGTRPGRAVPVDGGYLVSGAWQFASGMAHASHIHSAIQVEGTGELRVLAMPRSEVVLDGNWDVLGLRATYSVDYHCDDVYVPATHTYPATTTTPANGGAVYRLGLVNLSALGHTGWAFGVGRRLLDELRSVAAARTGTRNAPVDTSQFHAEYATAEAGLRAARAWAMEVWQDIEATLDAGELPTPDQDTLLRLTLNHATTTALDVGRTVHRWAGTAAMRRGPMDRFLRDLNTGSQHITSSPVVLQNCGMWLSGARPQARWTFLDLGQD